MSWESVFYWISRADDVKGFFDTLSNVLLFFTILFFVVWWVIFVVSRDPDTKLTESDIASIKYWLNTIRKTFIWFFSTTIITWSVYVFVPSKKDCIMIIAGSAVANFVTSDSSARAIPADLMEYLHISLKEEIKEVRESTLQAVTADERSPEQKLADTLETMSKGQIIEYLKNR